MIRLTALLALGLTFLGRASSQVSTTGDFAGDFDYAWRQIGAMYAYPDAKATAWSEVPRLFGGDLQRVRTRGEFVSLLEHVLDEWYDPHMQLTTNTATSPRLVPSGTDIWAEWQAGQAVITEVRAGSDAQRAALRPGMIITAINNVRIRDAVESRLGRTYPHSVDAAREWALRAVIAGHHNERRLLEVQDGRAIRMVDLFVMTALRMLEGR